MSNLVVHWNRFHRGTLDKSKVERSKVRSDVLRHGRYYASISTVVTVRANDEDEVPRHRARRVARRLSFDDSDHEWDEDDSMPLSHFLPMHVDNADDDGNDINDVNDSNDDLGIERVFIRGCPGQSPSPPKLPQPQLPPPEFPPSKFSPPELPPPQSPPSPGRQTAPPEILISVQTEHNSTNWQVERFDGPNDDLTIHRNNRIWSLRNMPRAQQPNIRRNRALISYGETPNRMGNVGPVGRNRSVQRSTTQPYNLRVRTLNKSAFKNALDSFLNNVRNRKARGN